MASFYLHLYKGLSAWVGRKLRTALAEPVKNVPIALRFTPCLERLEDRHLLTTWYWLGDNLGGGANAVNSWSDINGNLNTAANPLKATDDYVFDPSVEIPDQTTSNAICDWNLLFAVHSVTLGGAYTGRVDLLNDLSVTSSLDLETTRAGGGISDPNFNGRRLIVDPNGGQATVKMNTLGVIDVPVIFEAGTTTTVSGSGIAFTQDVTNWGSFTWDVGSRMSIAEPFTNYGTSFLNSDRTMIAAAPRAIFYNMGTLRKTSSVTTTVDPAINNVSNFSVEAGTLQLSTGTQADVLSQTVLFPSTTLTARTYTCLGGTFAAGNATFVGDLCMSGATLQVGGAVAGQTAFSVMGNYTQTGGSTLVVAADSSGVATLLQEATPGGAAGQVNLGGTAFFSINPWDLPGATPPAGVPFIKYQKRVGDFANWSSNQPNGWTKQGQNLTVTGENANANGTEHDVIIGAAPPPPGKKIQGNAFKDANGNGRQDNGEGGLANLAVTLTAPGGGTSTSLTDPSGHFQFDGLASGTYIVSVAAPTGGVLGGYYLDDGTPVPNGSATVSDSQPISDLDAAFIAGASTSTSLTSSSSAVYAGQQVSLTVNVTPATGTGAPTGRVDFYDGTTWLGNAVLTPTQVGGAQATLSSSTLVVGSHDITAVYNGDSTYAGSTSPDLIETVQQPTSSTALAVSTATSVPGQTVTFTATVSGTGGSSAPTGTVNFFDGATQIGTGTLTPGSMNYTAQATFNTSALTLGSHSITVSYAGDATYAGSTSAAVSETVQTGTTTTSLSDSPSSTTYGQTVTFTATVTSGAPGAPAPTGTVSFYDGQTLLGSVALAVTGGMNQASLSVSSLSVGSHSVTSSYSGDGSFGGSTSSAVTETVSPLPSTVSLAESPATSTQGQAVTFTATVSSSGAAPTGTVTFYDGNAAIGTGTLTSGANGVQATFTTSSLSVGSHSITAGYGGDATHASASSGSVTETVQAPKPAPSISLSSSSTSAQAGMQVSFTATVTPPSGGAIPTGTVTFYDGGTALGTVTLSTYMGYAAQAVFTTSTLSAGTHSITAVYSGSSTYAGVTSSAVTETVSKGSDMVMESSSSSSVPYGTAVTFTATLSGTFGSLAPTGTISFYDGSTLLGTVTVALVNGSYKATFTTSTLSRGSHTIQAVYSGDANYVSSSASLTESIF